MQTTLRTLYVSISDELFWEPALPWGLLVGSLRCLEFLGSLQMCVCLGQFGSTHLRCLGGHSGHEEQLIRPITFLISSRDALFHFGSNISTLWLTKMSSSTAWYSSIAYDAVITTSSRLFYAILSQMLVSGLAKCWPMKGTSAQGSLSASAIATSK